MLSKRNPAVLGQWGKGKPRVLAKNWGDPVKWNKNPFVADHEWVPGLPKSERRTHRRSVFPSLCDWLDEEVPIKWLERFLELIQKTQNLNWLLLTKRPENFVRRLREVQRHMTVDPLDIVDRIDAWISGDRVPQNVWVGTSVEDQQRADERIPELLKIPAKLRFLSIEPLLSQVDLRGLCADGLPSTIDWVILGGESGPKSRRSDVKWIRFVVRQCGYIGIPCFVKQLGAFVVDRNDRGFEGDSDPSGWPMDTSTNDCVEPGIYQGKPVRILTRHPKGGDPSEWPRDLRVRQFPEVKP